AEEVIPGLDVTEILRRLERKLGRAAVAPLAKLGREELYERLSDAGVRALFTQEELAKMAEKKRETMRKLTLTDILRELTLDVAAYNSKFYYVITDGAGYGEQVVRFPYTGNETVLDAVSQIQGLPAVASKKKVWAARATPDHQHPYILPVDWRGIAQRGSAGTNYQLFPGDRVYVDSNPLIRADSRLGQFLAPI